MKVSVVVATLVLLAIAYAGWHWWSRPSVYTPVTLTPPSFVSTNGSPTEDAEQSHETSDHAQMPKVMPPIVGANLVLGIGESVKLGTYVVGYTGKTLYTYAKDTINTSTCYDLCGKSWPAYVVSPQDDIHQLQEGLTGVVATTHRSNGTLQVTYNSHPLYFYVGDKSPGDTKGEGVGGVWHVIKP